MSALRGKKLILAVTGSIAAYKAAFLTRLFIKNGAEVKVLMTDSAKHFLSPLTLSTLSKNPVISTINSEESWSNHVELGLWADALIIAPATANTIAKLANGHCDNIISAVYLSARCPVFVAPAMDLDMWAHPATQKNCQQLLSYNNHLIDVEEGELASGLVGAGRMAEPENILQYLANYFKNTKPEFQPLKAKKVLITSGPTQEAIDPVRYITNHSSGKMGSAIAEQMAHLGAQVYFVSGPAPVQAQHPNIQLISVQSAEDMYQAAKSHFETADIIVLAAAVADYTPKYKSTQKIKKKEGDLSIELKRTKDIAASMGKLKKEGQILVGFALETNDAFANAERKLKSKNLDFIVLNKLQDKGAGFGYDSNKVCFINRKNDRIDFELKSKKEVAKDIIHYIIKLIEA